MLPENPIKYYIDLEYLYKTCYNKLVRDLSGFERYCLLLKAEEPIYKTMFYTNLTKEEIESLK